MQQPYPAGSPYASAPQPTSEDCLYLNVWTAAKAQNDSRPVMIWIHGGAWTRGSGSTASYDGTALAKKGVVVVTTNYRLGAFGFLAHPELTSESPNRASGNYAILDHVAALKWVQKNIAAFGGDPSRVTIFGESAGSWSVNVVQATPLANGLFHRAIGESGGQFARTASLAASPKGLQPRVVRALFGSGFLGDPERWWCRARRRPRLDLRCAVAIQFGLSSANPDRPQRR